MKEIHQYSHHQDLPLMASFYPAENRKEGLTLIYFHGGGLIYGNRDDLPTAYIELLNNHGYHLLTVDYPLIPEVTIAEITACLSAAIDWFKLEHNQLLGLGSANFCLFGRSAGAYLSLLLAHQHNNFQLKGIVSFYGYDRLDYPAFNQASSYYKKYPAVPFMTVYQLTQGAPKSQASINERFPIYLSYRQTGQWVKQLLGKNPQPDFSLTSKSLQELPPTFLAASRDDQDVPFDISLKMAQQIPENYLYQVKELPHDFDADSRNPAAQEAYRQLINWLNRLK